MDALFLKCMPVIFKNEGGYVNDPDDPGGETNMGITKLFYPDEDIKNLTVERATELYYNDYWLAMNFTGIILNDDLILQVFDMGVNSRTKNSGFKPAIRILQRVLSVTDDGIMGPMTKNAIHQYSGNITEDYKEGRRSYYKSLPQQKPVLAKYVDSWLRRVDNTHF
jgi:lysozyme family protein